MEKSKKTFLLNIIWYGNQPPSADEMEAMAHHFGIEVSDFSGGEPIAHLKIRPGTWEALIGDVTRLLVDVVFRPKKGKKQLSDDRPQTIRVAGTPSLAAEVLLNNQTCPEGQTRPVVWELTRDPQGSISLQKIGYHTSSTMH